MRAFLLAALLLAAGAGGCLDSKGGDDDGDGTSTSTTTTSGTLSGTGSRSNTSTGSSNGTTGTGIGNATLLADVVNGTAPLAVNFTINATTGALAWRLTLGDGNATNGTAFPAAYAYTYDVAGNFSANLTVVFATGNASAEVPIQVTLGDAGGMPDVTHFEFGESLGCAADLNAQAPQVPPNCISYLGGPDASGIDGHWQALDERYWGLTVTTTMDSPENHDSDCFFIAEDETTILGNGHNGGDLCMGVVPEGTAWFYLYPWGTPAVSMTADFA